jgi:hypothetical protein
MPWQIAEKRLKAMARGDTAHAERLCAAASLPTLAIVYDAGRIP